MYERAVLELRAKSTAACSSVSLGARIIEKHFTKDNNFSDFRDHQLSANPTDMKRMVQLIRELDKMRGSGEKNMQLCEKESLIPMRRSVVARKLLSRGKILQSEDISWVRPGGGLEPGKESLIVGKKLKQDIYAGEKILLRHLED